MLNERMLASLSVPKSLDCSGGYFAMISRLLGFSGGSSWLHIVDGYKSALVVVASLEGDREDGCL